MNIESKNMNREILAKRARLQADRDCLKEPIDDSTLTEEDRESLEAYEAEKKAGKRVPHKHLKQELGL